MKGKIYVVGTGPGVKEQMSLRAVEIIESVDIVIGYKTYIDLLEDSFRLKEVISSGMRKELERCEQSLEIAESGKTVALVSSGDPGIYGMAGIMLEIVEREKSSVQVEIVPGITSCLASASLLGAPIMHDFAVISLSDLLTEWKLIRKRIKSAAKSDFVICLYNPASRSRKDQVKEARSIILKSRDVMTPVGIVRDAMRTGEEIIITDLRGMLEFEIDMSTTIIIGNSRTYVSNNRMITPRGYPV